MTIPKHVIDFFLCSMYDLGIWTYVIALTHFLGELFVFRGCKLNGPFMAPLTVAGNIHISVGVIFYINSYFGSFISHLASFSQGSICKILDTLVIYIKNSSTLTIYRNGWGGNETVPYFQRDGFALYQRRVCLSKDVKGYPE